MRITKIAAKADSSSIPAKSNKLKTFRLKKRINKIANNSTTPLTISDELLNFVGKIRREIENTTPRVVINRMHKNPAKIEIITTS